jgi:hypothetical protein
MPLYSALKAIVLGAFRTVEFLAFPLGIEDECIVAVSCGTPGQVLLDIQSGFQRKVLEFYELLLR